MNTLYIFWMVWIICCATATAITWDKHKSVKDQAGLLLTIFIGSTVITGCVMLCHRNEP
jgi:hypothetical protein